MSSPKDLFSKQANLYAIYRPQYPRELFHFLSSLCESHEQAWDCATGNGQAALPLAEYFAKVLATDLSQKQLDQAESHPKITFLQGSAEKSGLADKATDLISVAQAFHWFHFLEFYNEVLRVGKPGGILAVWTYNLPRHSEDLDRVLLHFYSQVLGPFWDPERKHVELGYADIKVPFPELKAPNFQMFSRWRLEHMLGYLETWSATQKWKAQNPGNQVANYRDDFAKAWGAQVELEFHWPLSLRVFRLPS
jgi:SAM-dependent methyltransferase